jgi:DNA mismatch repair protein MutS
LFDELGRGTSTYDGMALAQAIIEYIALNIKAKTLFSTHYHELTLLEGKIEGIVNKNVSVYEENDKVTFLYKIIEEPANKSYGINVARLAHLPNDLLNRAQQILNELERNKVTAKDIEYKVEEENKEDELLIKLKEIDPLSLSPMEALNILYELNKEAKKKK